MVEVINMTNTPVTGPNKTLADSFIKAAVTNKALAQFKATNAGVHSTLTALTSTLQARLAARKAAKATATVPVASAVVK
jgi:hypothetical protein